MSTLSSLQSFNRTTSSPFSRELLGAYSCLLQRASNNLRMNIDLETLFKGIPVLDFTGKKDTKVRAICTDSRRVSPGDVFFAVGGLRTDGNLYIEEAVHRGAAAIVTENKGHVPARTAYVLVENIRETLSDVARRFYGNPEKDLELIGVTGTNGKTTVSSVLKYFLDEAEEPVGLLGTINYQLGRRSLPATRTTPDSLDLYAMFAQMKEFGCKKAIMEVSSHGLEQKRVHKLNFKVAAFLNLTQDHLDYHGNMEEYYMVKQQLFDGRCGSVPETAVINQDDPYGQRLLTALPGDVSALTFSVMDSRAAFYVKNLVLNSEGASFILCSPEGEMPVKSPLLGHYNVSNVLAALAMGYATGASIDVMIKRLRFFDGVAGRMDRVDCGQDFTVLVDYAHTEDAIANALQMLREVTKGRLFVVFGCGGDRDRSKRPLMTRATMEGSDFCWATADNPRGEDQLRIFEDMKAGITDPERIKFVEDRRWAINLALSEAKEGDTVLIAGKGHEAFQEYADSVVPFDDRQIAKELLELKQRY